MSRPGPRTTQHSGPGKVVVAMSGGVDSSVAAALLVEQGHDVVGVTMHIWPALRARSGQATEEGGRERGCCSVGAAQDARAVARVLDIPHYVLNLQDVFERTVIADFVSEYSRGRTPNPCIRCNEHVKFAALLRRAAALEADYVATGHYARIAADDGTGRLRLLRGVDSAKDQSYVLYSLRQKQLARILFPLGGATKAEARCIAATRGLPVADKGESQEICFVPDDYVAFLRERAPDTLRPGPILDLHGNVIGQHRGAPAYTIGQRRGLGIGAPRPLYVVGIDPNRNAVIVGEASDVVAAGCVVEEVSWVAGEAPELPLRAQVKIRYRAPAASATINADGREVTVRFAEPQRAVTPGQAAVFYRADEVLGGGTIAARLDGPKAEGVASP